MPPKTKANEVNTLLIKQTQILNALDRNFQIFKNVDKKIKNNQILIARGEKVEELWKEFSTIQTALSEQLVDTNETWMEFENMFFEIKAILAEQTRDTSSKTPYTSNPQVPQVQVKLPPIELPSFDGNYCGWTAYKDAFIALIHENKTLTSVQKMHYLKSSLTGTAAQIIENLAITDANYLEAYEMVTNRFQKPRFIVQNHVKQLFSLRPVRKNNISDYKQLCNEFMKNVRALKALGYYKKESDFLLTHLLTSKFDTDLFKGWENTLETNTDEMPSLEQVEKYLLHQISVLELTEIHNNPSINIGRSQQVTVTRAGFKEKSMTHFSKTSEVNNDAGQKKVPDNGSEQKGFQNAKICQVCGSSEHSIYNCEKFLILKIPDRIKLMRSQNRCLNCLKLYHSTMNCNANKCKICNLKHNTLLHLNQKPQETQTTCTTETVHSPGEFDGGVLLATALIKIASPITKDSSPTINTRCLLDSGAQNNFITENLVQILKLPRKRINCLVGGIGNNTFSIKYATEATIKSTYNTFERTLTFLVLPKITEALPSQNIDIKNWKIPTTISLADPEFYKSSKTDVLIGADLFFDLLHPKKFKIEEKLPTFQKTHLGWIVTGKYPTNTLLSHYSSSLITTLDQLSDQMKQFWEINDEPFDQESSNQDNYVEQNYTQTTKRNHEGRYMVRLPIKDPKLLGNSQKTALSRFFSLEQKLLKNTDLQKQYQLFMTEYADLGHMKRVNEKDTDNSTKYYLPHHGVIKENSVTTKLRVVFNGSSKTTTGYSLNDILYTGPRIQQELYQILLRFRTHKYVLTADVKMMFRQILIQNDQTKFQRIFWRNDPNEELYEYELKTVTYGTTSAPYLAARTLHQLAYDESENYPLAAKATVSDFYMDDLLTGTDTEQDLKELQSEIQKMFDSAKLPLRKWCSNCPSLSFKNLSKEEDPNFAINISDNKDLKIKSLGVNWVPYKDAIQYSIKLKSEIPRTKRAIVSEISSIYDPLGLIGPIVTQARLLIQELWLLKIDWDVLAPDEFIIKWVNFRKTLPDIANFNIPRWISSSSNTAVEIHGFCDASTRAYGACIFVKCITPTGYVTNLLTSRSRVAPIKEMTLPRLELCGALLLAQLYDTVRQTINLKMERTYLWSDSTIVLAWIAREASKWKAFVANRVTEIQKLTDNCIWRHVPSQDNPADTLSRGCSPPALAEVKKWWHGPQWINSPEECWPNAETVKESGKIPEEKPLRINLINVTMHQIEFARFSSWSRLVNSYAYVLRFIKNCKIKKDKRELRQTGLLTLFEINKAEEVCIKVAQIQEFASEIDSLKKNTEIKKDSKILPLNPFLDDNEILRVGGRLQNSILPFNQRHPIILPKSHTITKLILIHLHKLHLHPGANSLLYFARTRYWPINGKSLCNLIVHQCLVCYKARPKPLSQQMAPLPAERVTFTKPFLVTGVDFAGPITIKSAKRKNAPLTKAYVSVFVCFTTRAIHLELVSGLDSDSFIACLRRFIARRGPCNKIYSDNATNFTGAKNKLNFNNILKKSEAHKQRLHEFTQTNKIDWQFIPPSSPHFGGLWEAGVKSMKTHLKKIVGNTNLTFEEMYTALSQIETVLNSRPLIPLPSENDDLAYLTPSHFLIGTTPVAIPDQDYSTTTTNNQHLLNRWQLVQRLCHQFWTRWYHNYLSTLQSRCKWQTHKTEVPLGAVVLIKEDNLPPLQWKIGRIIELVQGKDGLSRVAVVKNAAGALIKRPIVKLCPLPTQ